MLNAEFGNNVVMAHQRCETRIRAASQRSVFREGKTANKKTVFRSVNAAIETVHAHAVPVIDELNLYLEEDHAAIFLEAYQIHAVSGGVEW